MHLSYCSDWRGSSHLSTMVDLLCLRVENDVQDAVIAYSSTIFNEFYITVGFFVTCLLNLYTNETSDNVPSLQIGWCCQQLSIFFSCRNDLEVHSACDQIELWLAFIYYRHTFAACKSCAINLDGSGIG